MGNTVRPARGRDYRGRNSGSDHSSRASCLEVELEGIEPTVICATEIDAIERIMHDTLTKTFARPRAHEVAEAKGLATSER